MTRGGIRVGSGRKAINDEEKRVTTSFRLSPTSKEKIPELRKRGINLGLEIDKLIEHLFNHE